MEESNRLPVLINVFIQCGGLVISLVCIWEEWSLNQANPETFFLVSYSFNSYIDILDAVHPSSCGHVNSIAFCI